MTIISVHDPTEEANFEVKEIFYEQRDKSFSENSCWRLQP